MNLFQLLFLFCSVKLSLFPPHLVLVKFLHRSFLSLSRVGFGFVSALLHLGFYRLLVFENPLVGDLFGSFLANLQTPLGQRLYTDVTFIDNWPVSIDTLHLLINTLRKLLNMQFFLGLEHFRPLEELHSVCGRDFLRLEHRGRNRNWLGLLHLCWFGFGYGGWRGLPGWPDC